MATLALFHALLWTLIFPPIGWWPLALFAAAPLFALGVLAGEAGMRPMRAAAIAWLTALPAWAFHERWLIDVTIPGYPLLAMYLSAQQLLVVWAGARLRQRAWRDAPPHQRRARTLLALAIIWAGVEALRGAVVFDGYPWFYLGHPMVEVPGLRGLASVIGAFGASAIVAAINAFLVALALARPTEMRSMMRFAAGLVAFAALGGAGLLLERNARSAMESWPTLRVGIVQTNVPQSNKMNWEFAQRVEDFRAMAAMTAEAADQGAELILWPETMYPGLGLNKDAREAERELATGFVEALEMIQEAAGTPMIVGAMAREGVRLIEQDDGTLTLEQDASYNSAFLVAQGAMQEQRYDKVHLTPFGEVMPYISWSEWLERRLLAIGAPGMSFDLEVGEAARALRVPLRDGELGVATPICFEATNPAVVRRLLTRNGARAAGLIAHLTNDGWFTRWAGGREQHVLLTRWRAIETRTPAARAANTGISVGIDAVGRVVRQRAARSEGALVVDLAVAQGEGSTAFMRFGWALQWVVLAAGVALFGVAALSKEQAPTPAKPTEESGAGEQRP